MIAYFIFLRFVAFFRFEAGSIIVLSWARLESTEGLLANFNFWLGVARVHAKDFFGSNHGWVELRASGGMVVSISFMN